MRKFLNSGTLVIILFIVPSANVSAGGFLGDVWGVVTDPFKLKSASEELSASVSRTLDELRRLEQQANVDVRDRIEQVGSIVDTVLDATDKNVSNLSEMADRALIKMASIERQAHQDAMDLIYRAQCLNESALMDQLQRSLAQLIENIIASNPGVEILGIRVVDVEFERIKIVDPDKAYLSTKRYYLDRLQEITPSDNAYEFLSTYQNIARFARFTRCHYIETSLAAIFVEEVAEFERLSKPWLQVVRPEIQ